MKVKIIRYSLDDIQQQLTILKNRFVRYNEYADLTIDQIFTPEELEAPFYMLKILRQYHREFEADQFEITALPKETQLSPIYGLATGDYNQDGHLDIVMVEILPVPGWNLTEMPLGAFACWAMEKGSSVIKMPQKQAWCCPAKSEIFRKSFLLVEKNIWFLAETTISQKFIKPT